jgi:hypothetical protein
MANANEPRRMTPRGNSADPRQYDAATGNVARDGYDRIARRTPPSHPQGDAMSPYGFSIGASDEITPQVGERDWNRGPRYSED